MRITASSTRGGPGSLGSEKTARLHHGPAGHMLYDVVPEYSKASYLGPLLRDNQDRGPRAQNEEGCEREDRLNGICASPVETLFHKPKFEKSVDISGTATRSGSSQHDSMRDVNCKVSKVF